jgi:hypothetical protein
MAQDLTNAIAEGFSEKVIERFLRAAIAPDITNDDYEGELKAGGIKSLRILTLGEVGLQDYTVSTDMNPSDLSISKETFTPEKQRAYYFKIDDLEAFWSKIKDLNGKFTNKAGDALKKEIDQYVLGKYTQVKAGHRIGTDYVLTGNGDTAKVTITGATGAVVGVGSAFTSGMVGKGFKADTSTVWYKITAYTDATHITIKNWDDTLPLTDGDHGGTGVGCKVEANTVLTVTKDTIFGYIDDLGTLLDEDDIPDEDRWLVVPPKIAAIIRRAPELTPAVPAAYEDIRLKGILGTVDKFKIYVSNQVAGNNTTGYYVLAGTKDFVTFAVAFTESKVEEDIPKQFGKGYKGLTVYGGTVATERRKCGAYLFCKV